MEYERIKQLIEDMGNSKLEELNIDFPDGTKISMKKESGQKISAATTTIENNVKLVEVSSGEDVKVSDDSNDESELIIIKSPMVGTFYSKPSPDSKAYVSVGDRISVGNTVCIIEAMKLMNEIESEYDGEVSKILVNDGDVVEYGTPLFGIKI